jgi:hypothetical protein
MLGFLEPKKVLFGAVALKVVRGIGFTPTET